MFVQDVFNCIAKELQAGRFDFQCQIYKYGYLMLLLKKKGIVPCIDPEKIPCVQSIAWRVTQVASQLRGLFDPKHGTMSIPNGVKCVNQKHADRPCAYCARDFGSQLELLVRKSHQNVPGLCLSCLREGEERLCQLDACRHGLEVDGTSDDDSEEEGSGGGDSDDQSTSTEE